MQPGVFGLVDHTHATAAKFFDDAVVRDYLVDHSEEMQLPGRSILTAWIPLVNE